MNTKDLVKQLNLNEKESAIYLALLELGTAGATTIATKAGVQRTYFYDLSEKLIQMGFIKQTRKGNKRLFYAIDPEKIVEIEEARLKELKKMVPELRAIYNTKGQKPRIFYYEGKQGILNILNDTNKYKGETLVFSTPEFLKRDQKSFSNEYIKSRVAFGNSARVIGEISDDFLTVKSRDKEELRETRLLPSDIYHSNVQIGIYANKVYVLDYKNEFGFIIESSEVSNTMKVIFELIWGSGRIF